MAKFDIHQAVTDTIITMIENGQADGSWSAPWNQATSMPVNLVSKNNYNGINVLLLWGSALRQGFSSNVWASYKQWSEKGCQVKKGSKSTMITFWKSYEKTVVQADGTTEDETRIVPRYYNVFNADQVEGYDAPTVDATETSLERIQRIDQVIINTGANIVYGGNRACYIPSMDQIALPNFQDFTSVEGFYSTAFHELAHWTGSKTRLDRDLSGRFGDESYAMEELVAELSAAFTCANLGITSETRQDHAKYIKSWLKVLKNDKKAISAAASKASKATDFIMQGEATEEQSIAA